MRTKFAIALAIAAVCATAAWAAWTPESKITGDGSSDRQLHPSNGHKLVFGPDGVGHLIWWRYLPLNAPSAGVYCNRYNPSSGWTPDYQLSQAGEYPSIALDADGTTIHAVWFNATPCYRRCVRNEYGEDVWGEVMPLCQDREAYGPVVACVPNEPGHVVISYKEEFGSKKGLRFAIGLLECVGGVWQTPIRLDSGVSGASGYPSIAVAPNGDLFIAYHGKVGVSPAHIYVKTRRNGVWQPTQDATPGLTGYASGGFPVEANPYTGHPHVVFNAYKVTKISKKVSDTTSAVLHTYRNSSGVWQVPETVSVPGHRGSFVEREFRHPTMAFVDDGSAYVTWAETYRVGRHGVMFSYCPGEGLNWSTPEWLTPDPDASYGDENPFVTVDESADSVRAAWTRTIPSINTEPIEIWWRSGSLGSGGGGMGRPVAPARAGVELFPNPTKAGRVTVQYALPHAGPVTVTLLDISGRTVRTQEVAADRSGSARIDVSGLTAGVYVARLVAGDLSISKSLVVEH